MRKTLIVLLVVLVVLLALPALGMAASMDPCPKCDLATGTGGCGMCLAVLFLLTVAAPLATTSLHRPSAQFRPPLLPVFVDRPPRFS